jgi:hypothetical protein
VRIALGQPSKLGRIKPRIHASQNGKASRRRHGQLRFVAKVGNISLIRCNHFLKNFAHIGSLNES